VATRQALTPQTAITGANNPDGHGPGPDPAARRSGGGDVAGARPGQGLSLEQSLRDLLIAAARQGESLRDDLVRLRATTPLAGRNLDVVALIRDDRDGR